MKSTTTVLFSLFLLFLIAGLIATYVAIKPHSTEEIAGKIADELRHELETVDEELEKLSAAIKSGEQPPLDVRCPFLIYDNDSLTYWSDNSYIPAPQSVADTFALKLYKTASEAYLVRKKIVDGDVFIVSLIKLYRKYSINNDYLRPEWNEKILPSSEITVLEPSAAAGTPVCINNQCLFRITPLPGDLPTRSTSRQLAVIFILIAIASLIGLSYRYTEILGKRIPEAGFLLLFLTFFVVRLVMTFFNFPIAWVRSRFLDPQVFAVSAISPSLGDLFFNILAVTALCFYLFKHFYRFSVLNYRKTDPYRWIFTVISALCLLFAGLFPFVVIQTLYNNSAIVLDITQSLKFDGLRIIAMVSVLLSGVCSFLFSHVFIRILAAETSGLRLFSAILLGVIIFIGINDITGQHYLVPLIITIIYFLVVYYLGLYANLKRLSYATFAYLFISVFCLSASGAYAIRYFSHKEKIANQFRFASNFLIDRDYFGEYLLDEASNRIANDAFTQVSLVSPFLSKESIAQKIRQHFLPSYFNKYDVDIFIFDGIGQPVEDSYSGSFSQLMYSYDQHAQRTENGIYFVNNPHVDVTQKYSIVVPIKRASSIAGYVVVELSLKKIIPENVYPELLVDHSFQQFYRTHDMSYAVFSNKKLLFTSGEFNYEKQFDRSWLGDPKLYTIGISKGYDHIAQDDQASRVAVVSTPSTPFIYRLAEFSFFFVLGLFIILLMLFVQGTYNYFTGRRLFFSARIQLYLNLAFFIPLIIVSISTLSLTTLSSQKQLGSEYLNKSNVFAGQITSYLNDFIFRDPEQQISFSNQLGDLANLSNLDANVYRVDGTLLATSQPRIFESNLLSQYINPNAHAKIKNGENAFIESERVGQLEYFVAYTALKSPQTGTLIGILGIPFFQSGYLLEQVQITILTNILNIFALIFIVLLVLSYFVSQWLTFPLRIITQSLRRTSLTKVNKPLSWTAGDEIGLMVKEYNSMLFKLSESKSELEHTQREKAWREIAQQVAHEIKNPLTPMKLTLQQLERSLQTENGSAEKTKKAVAALLAQVNTLNEIASSFSGFAKMPEPVMRQLELISTVKTCIELHSLSGEIHFRHTAKEIFVMGDEQLLSRTFSNIILNGLQAGRPGQSVNINVSVEKIGTYARVTFRDNGKGIDPQIADRVFLPHFSTKRSGSGLGLAIAKQGIEQMNGKIWFETELGKGTTFFIELPLLQ